MVSRMISINHYGNGVMSFDGLVSTSRRDIADLISAITADITPEGCYRDEEGRILNHGGYIHGSKGDVEMSPLRYTNCVYEGISAQNIETIRTIEKAIYQAVVNYCQYFPSAIPSIRWKKRGYLIKYGVGRYMGPHSDSAIPYMQDKHTPINQQPLCNTLTCTIVLNDEFTGGETGFRPWNLTIPSKFCRILVFPANFAGCHEVLPIISGERFAYLSWYCHGDIDKSSPKFSDNVDFDEAIMNEACYLNIEQFEKTANMFIQEYVPIGELPKREEM